jgi:O-antigen/teichoic acid export membrane protein
VNTRKDDQKGNLNVAMTGSVGKRVASNARMLMIAKAVAAAVGFITLMIATRGLSKPELGVVVFLHSYMLFFAEVTTFQSWQALIRYGTEDLHDQHISRFKKLLRFCIALDFLSALLAFIAAVSLFALIGYAFTHISALHNIGNQQEFQSIQKYVYVYCLLVFASQQGAAIGVLRLFDKFNLLAFRALVMPLTRLILTLIAYRSGAGIEGYIAAWFLGSLFGKTILPVLALLELKKRELTHNLFTKMPNLTLKRDGLWAFVWKTNIDSTLAAGITHLPLILIGPVFGTAYVAVYKIAEEVANLLSRGIKLLDQVIYPEFARMISLGDHHKIGHIALKTAGILLGVGLILSSLVGVFGPYLIEKATGGGYQDVAFLAMLLVMAAAISGVSAPIFPIFYATNKPGLAIKVRIAGLMAYGCAFAVLSKVLGFNGPGWAAVFGNTVAVALAVFYGKAVLQHQYDVSTSSDN